MPPPPGTGANVRAAARRTPATAAAAGGWGGRPPDGCGLPLAEGETTARRGPPPRLGAADAHGGEAVHGEASSGDDGGAPVNGCHGWRREAAAAAARRRNRGRPLGLMGSVWAGAKAAAAGGEGGRWQPPTGGAMTPGATQTGGKLGNGGGKGWQCLLRKDDSGIRNRTKKAMSSAEGEGGGVNVERGL